MESSRRDLRNALLCTVLHRSLISIFSSKIAIFFATELMKIHYFNRKKKLAIFDEKIPRRIPRERCKGVHCVDLGESFPTHIFLQKLASIQPRTSPVKFARELPAAQFPDMPFPAKTPRESIATASVAAESPVRNTTGKKVTAFWCY